MWLSALVALATLVVFPALSGASAIDVPAVSTNPASGVTANAATLNGTVNPNDPDVGASYTFSWGTDTSYGTNVTGTTPPGSLSQPVSEPISGLSPGHTYHFKLCATNAPEPPGGTTCGSDSSFTTLAAPTVTTGGATSVTPTGATLNGTVNPNGDDTSYTFSYGTSPGIYTGTASGSAGSGTSAQSVSEAIGGLAGQTTYYYQLCATNSVSTTCGTEQSFTTPDQPSATTGNVTAIGQTSATLHGTVNPHGASTTYSFEYGTSSGSYGNPGGGSVGSGTTDQSVQRTISSLTPATTYYYRLCATNTYGTPCGAEQSFTTTSPPPTVTTAAATDITPTTATLRGTVNPNGDTTSYEFRWGTSSGVYPNTAGGSGLTGTSALSVSLGISGLSGRTTYYYKLCATNGTGTACGSELSFSTPNVPSAATGAASAIGQTGATLNGTVNPNGATTSYTFQWGTSSGSYTGSGGGSGLSGTSDQAVALALGGLTARTTYYYRLCASNTFGGPVCGAEQSFTTLDAPSVTTGDASSIGQTGATLNGTVNPNGAATSYHFEWGTASGSWPNSTTSASAGSGTSGVPKSSAISGLSAHTTYYFRLCATNTYGSPCGAEKSFTTTSPPTVATQPATSISPSSATLNGTVNPRGDATTYTFKWGTSSGSYPNTTRRLGRVRHDRRTRLVDDRRLGDDDLLLPALRDQRDRNGLRLGAVVQDPGPADRDNQRRVVHHSHQRDVERNGEPERRRDELHVLLRDKPGCLHRLGRWESLVGNDSPVRSDSSVGPLSAHHLLLQALRHQHVRHALWLGAVVLRPGQAELRDGGSLRRHDQRGDALGDG